MNNDGLILVYNVSKLNVLSDDEVFYKLLL